MYETETYQTRVQSLSPSSYAMRSRPDSGKPLGVCAFHLSVCSIPFDQHIRVCWTYSPRNGPFLLQALELTFVAGSMQVERNFMTVTRPMSEHLLRLALLRMTRNSQLYDTATCSCVVSGQPRSPACECSYQLLLLLINHNCCVTSLFTSKSVSVL